jgi:hypothetical protein
MIVSLMPIDTVPSNLEKLTQAKRFDETNPHPADNSDERVDVG